MSVRAALLETRARNEKAVGLFLTCGYPDPAASDQILDVLAEAGADFIELGMPFSDPVGEGSTIQHSSRIALDHGITMRDVLARAERFKSRHDVPLVLMGYANPLHRYGIRSFCRDASAAGVDGLILADLSLEAAEFFENAAAEAGIELVFLVAPSTSDRRISEIDRRSTGFVYAVSTSALTGDDLKGLDDVQSYLERARRCVTNNPLLVGFGIDRHDLGMRLSAHTDGFIVGSALIRKIEEVWEQPGVSAIDRLDAVARFTTELKFGPNAT